MNVNNNYKATAQFKQDIRKAISKLSLVAESEGVRLSEQNVHAFVDCLLIFDLQ